MNKIVIEEELTVKPNDYLQRAPGTTECKDEQTCAALNEFLDEGYKQPPCLEFQFDITEGAVSTMISTRGMGARDKAELGIRLMRFVMNEVEKVKNGN